MSEDWDNLILLDACRFDQFERLNTINGDLQTRTSLGSGTPEFLTKNFEGTTHHDTVYITANPMYRTKSLKDVFHEVIDVWGSEWDDQQKTVRPEKMAEATLEAYEEFPGKRIISHFMQPHYPFIGDSAREIGDHAGYEWAYRRVQGEDATRDHSTIWALLDEGKVDVEAVWRAYDENLEIALPHVERLVNTFDEKVVVTSDHGNLVNERITPFGKRVSGHPIETYTDELRKVPWLVISGETRKEIHEEEPQEHTNGDSDVVVDRLADLGYVNT
ncbi:LTA synthase family protein [Halorubrum sp. CBA1229]|uniref:LTA synthase family protein n=1 Tax=Halorubrum sp. CBA1229 TaxID=1853699 RepID=UPI0020D0723E|nr:LTA synthase family protein [Halorubrum sp. CBA1229]